MTDLSDNVLADAVSIVALYNDRVLTADADAIKATEQRYRALVCEANGGTGFASYTEQGAGTAISKAVAAQPGAIPGWGQNGVFLIHSDHGRVMVEFESPLNGFGGFAFRAVDFGQPFVSSTGYRSHHGREYVGLSVEDAALSAYHNEVAAQGLTTIDLESRGRSSLTTLPDFVVGTDTTFQGVPISEGTDHQLQMVF